MITERLVVHGRTGHLEIYDGEGGAAPFVHGRTGHLEIHIYFFKASLRVHGRTGHLEILSMPLPRLL